MVTAVERPHTPSPQGAGLWCMNLSSTATLNPALKPRSFPFH